MANACQSITIRSDQIIGGWGPYIGREGVLSQQILEGRGAISSGWCSSQYVDRSLKHSDQPSHGATNDQRSGWAGAPITLLVILTATASCRKEAGLGFRLIPITVAFRPIRSGLKLDFTYTTRSDHRGSGLQRHPSAHSCCTKLNLL